MSTEGIIGLLVGGLFAVGMTAFLCIVFVRLARREERDKKP
jgi:hypothetical protein